jgi:hypothetical protein
VIERSENLKAEPALAGSARTLFTYELRRDGRVISTLEGKQSDSGTFVETVVFPVGDDPGLAGISRSFPFPSAEIARRFADDALVAFEYLNCSLA